MPLRIATHIEDTGNVLILEGWVSGPEVAELETVAGALSLPLRIDLTHVAGADLAGVAALHAQRARGATLVNGSPYVELLLRTHVADVPAPSGSGYGGRRAFILP
jgi:hypothetical protein